MDALPVPAARPFNLVFHRLANSLGGVEEARRSWSRITERQCVSSADLRPGVEGDLNWVSTGGSDFQFFLWHPTELWPSVRNATELDAHRKKLSVPLLEEILDATHPDLQLVLELKGGTGARETAIEQLAGVLGNHDWASRVWIDSYVPSDLELVKRYNPTLQTSLHVSWLGRERALVTPPSVGIRRTLGLICLRSLDRLGHADMITTFPRPTLQGTKQLVSYAQAFGKRIILGGLIFPGLLRLALNSGASGGYVRFRL